jgi:hypothetical protein
MRQRGLSMCSLLVAAAACGDGTGPSRSAEEILADRPFTPTDVNLFRPSFYPEAVAALPAEGSEPTEAEARALLDSYLTAEFPNDAAQRDASLAVVDGNVEALARLNSGTGSDLGLFATNGGAQVFPGSSSVTATSWNDAIGVQGAAQDTPGNPLLGLYLQAVQEPGKSVCSPETFSQALLQCIDQNQAALTNEDLVAAAEALKLDTSAETTP